jgi:adenylate cyclase
VLPFDDLSQGKTQEYFCDGLSDEIIGALTQVPGIRVVARSSAFQFKGNPQDVRRLGRQLQAAAVLERSVRRAAENLRITVHSTEDGYQALG